MAPNPPSVPRRPQSLTHHGHTRHDPYYWLRERTDREVRAYIDAENEYAAAMMAHTAELQATLYREMVARVQETDQSVPVRLGNYFYYTRTEKGRQYTIYCRRRGSMTAAEEILLDPNEIAANEKLEFLEVGLLVPSPDHNWLAYSLDKDGGERFTIRFKNLTSGEHLLEEIADTLYSGEWAADSRTFFYTTVNDAWRSDRLWRHTLGTSTERDTLIHDETDALFELTLYPTKDNAFLILWIRGIETYECRLVARNDPEGTWRLVEPRRRGHRYKIGHHDGRFFIWTNDEAPAYRIVTAPASSPGRENWETWLPHDEETTLLDFELFSGHAVVSEQREALPRIRVIDLATGNSHHVPLNEAVYALQIDEETGFKLNPTYETSTLRFVYSSLTTPKQTYDYDMVTRTRTLLKEEPVLGGFEAASYAGIRLWAMAADGEKIPISLVHLRNRPPTPDSPCLLLGYGAYGSSFDPSFRPRYLSLLDRGFVVAIAHVRGGQEMGRRWYDDGKFLRKKNTFTDFVAAARHLVEAGYTRPARLAIYGRSAGGLLMGAVVNLAPDLFQAVVAGVPFVDVVTTMLDETIPLTAGEWEEWGDPREETFYHYMLSYSPYDNLVPGAYPHILATSGLNDPRVQYWEPTKWVARLRTLKQDDSWLLLKTNVGAGHSGASGRYDYLREIAFEYAFIIDRLGAGSSTTL